MLRPRRFTGGLVAVVAAVLWASVGGPLYTADAQPPLPPAGACAANSTRFVGNMNGAQEVPPPPNPTNATGTFDMQLLTDGVTLEVYILTQNLNLAQVILAHIHSPGAPGVAAPVSFNLFLGPVGTFTNPFTARYTTTPLPANVLADMRAGNAYVNIHTTANPGGEIRGQIQCALPPAVACTATSRNFIANLTPAQEVLAGVPPPPPPPTLGNGVATLALGPDGSTLAVNIDIKDLSPNLVILSHIHGSAAAPGPPGMAAAVTVDFFLGPVGTFTDPFNVVVQVPTTVLQGMRNFQTYVNVHSVAFPGGEIRGEIECTNPPAPVSTVLNVPPSTGVANTPCASVAGQICGVTGGVTGVWTRGTPSPFSFTATGPANSLPGGTPAAFLPTTTAVEGFTCQQLGVSVPFNVTCTGNTAGNLLANATVTVRFPLLGGGTADVTGTVNGPGAGPVISVGQAIGQVQPTGTQGIACAKLLGANCPVTGGVSGTGTIASSMTWSLTSNVPANVATGTQPAAVISTNQGLQGFSCAQTVQGSTTVSCPGTTPGNALANSTVSVVFGPGQVTTGTVGTSTGSGTGTGTGLPSPLLPPPGPPPPPPLPPFPPGPPLPPPMPPIMPAAPLGPANGPMGPAMGPQMPAQPTNMTGQPPVAQPTATPTPAPMPTTPSGAPPMPSVAPPPEPAPMPVAPAPPPEPASLSPSMPEPMPGLPAPGVEVEPFSIAPPPADDLGDTTLPALAEEP